MVGNDEIHGNGGNDLLYGGAGDDTIFGGTGYDLIEGGTGNDVIDAGSEDDTVIWNTGDGNDTVNMGCGWDTLQVNLGAEDDYITICSIAENLVLIVGYDNVSGNTLWFIELIMGDVIEIYTGAGNDTVTIGDLSGTGINEIIIYTKHADS